MSDNGISLGLHFLAALFGPSTEQSVHICSLPNTKGEGDGRGERFIQSREASPITAFYNRWDKPGLAIYYCVSTVAHGSRRNKGTARETPALWVDIDLRNVEASEADVLLALEHLFLLPSVIIHSGHGLHAYWIFKEAVDAQLEMTNLEMALKQLADVVGGDPAVCHVAALMRLPGSHNTKGGEWLDVRLVAISERRYELEDICEWLAEQSPVIKRKAVECKGGTEIKSSNPTLQANPYLAIAERLGVNPPIDVGERLAAMTYQGAGNSSIHSTQLSVSASLLIHGHETEEVVDILLEATRAAVGLDGANWNWKREEMAIRKMCKSWMVKKPVEIHAAKMKRSNKRDAISDPADIPADMADVPADLADIPADIPADMDRVVNLGEVRKEKARKKASSAPPKANARAEKQDLYAAIAVGVILSLRAVDDVELLFEKGVPYLYEKGLWALETDLKHWLSERIEHYCSVTKITKTDTKIISEVFWKINRMTMLCHREVPWDKHGQIPTLHGLVDPVTGILVMATREHYVRWRIPHRYDIDAQCLRWLHMLNDMFADRSIEDRAAVIGVIQECVGAGLIDNKPKAMAKALVLLGGADSGKSQVLQVLEGLFGGRIQQAIGMVETTHGLVQFRNRQPWILDEAFNQSTWHMSSIVKTLITCDPVLINVKHGPMLTHRYTAPIFWATNYPPQFKESTDAITERLVIIKCNSKFDRDRPEGVAIVAKQAGFSSPAEYLCATEMPGILKWAVEGLQQVLANNNVISSPPEVLAARARVFSDSNLVRGFIEDCTEYDTGMMISMPDFCLAVCAWYAENKGENRSLPANETIGKALVALYDPRIAAGNNPELKDKKRRYVVGIKLNSLGLSFHAAGTEANMFEGKRVTTTTGIEPVNRVVPTTWRDRSAVTALVKE